MSAEPSTAVARNEAPHLRYTAALDGVRFVAIAFVVLGHALEWDRFGGGVGVDVFFVLSGYLITTILMSDFASSRLSLKRFYGRRMIRLAPALITAVVLGTVVAFFISPDRRDVIKGAIFALLYLTPITSTLFPTPGSWFGHTWTLGLEEYFYLVWPLALGLLFRRFVPWRTAVLLVTAAGVALLAVKGVADPWHTDPMGQLTVGGIAIGCALAIALRHVHRVPHPTAMLAVGLIVTLVRGFGAVDGPFSTAAYLVADVGAALMIAGIVGHAAGFPRKFLEWAPVVYLGKVSYEIYLVHYPILIGAAMATSETYRAVGWWVVPLSVIVAAALHESFAPMQRRLRHALDRRLKYPEAVG